MIENIHEKLPIEGIKDIRAARGGDVNDAYKIYTDSDIYYMLVQEDTDESFYDAEIEGLKLFEEIGITGPRVIANGFIDGDAYLILSFLDEGARGSQEQLAETVVKLHKYMSPNGKFGFDLPHRGSQTTFTNAWSDSWADVFINQRMNVLRDQLVDMNLWTKFDIDQYAKVRDIMERELSSHASEPSLLHGDLWGGNYMFLADGRPALFDPSPFYGDREFDLGITTVFGGFGQGFYERYRELYPLDPGYEFRLEFCRLYLLMVHLVKFGSTYERSVFQTMDKIINF